MHPPERPSVPFVGYLHVERESCERFLKIEYYAQIAMMGMESTHSLITYSEKEECYRMWSFSSSREEPMLLRGNFEGSTLVMVSDPIHMIWGLQKVRCSFYPVDQNSVCYRTELWGIDGYKPYFEGIFTRDALSVL